MLERNLLLRIASAIVGVPLVGALVLWGEPLPFALFCLLVGALALFEYAALLLSDRPATERAVVVAVGVAFMAALYTRPGAAIAWLMAALLVLAVVTLLRADEVKGATARLALAAFGVVYVGGLLVALPLMHRDLTHGPRWVALAIGVTFVNDTSAYFAGRALGRRKLAPVISPGKTVEGAVGGLLGSILFLFVAKLTFLPDLAVFDCIVVGLATGVLGPCGDLVESMLKRSVGAKDSGRLIPGHGGMLDRIDALMFVGAYVYLHTRLFP